jgi:hypothetical protein
LDSCDSGQGPLLVDCKHCIELRFRIKGK